MVSAVKIYKTGGPEVMTWESIDVGKPGKGEVRLRHTAVGLNFIDIYHRSGLYPVQLPTVLGLEAAGVVEELGSDVTGLKIGDRVAYAAPPLGAYAQARVMPAEKLVILPDSIPDQLAAAMMLRGMTAHYLLRRTYPVKAGETILIHAAAGGVGLIMCQWASQLGATVIGTVSSEEKAKLANENGCAYPIIYTKESFVKRVNEITDGKKVAAVYDSVGKETFMQSLDCIRPLGMIVSFGQSSGPIPPFDISVLSAKGSLFLTRPTLMTYTANRKDLENAAQDLFTTVQDGKVKIAVNQTYPLKEAAKAHRDLQSRKTTGSTVLTV